MNAPTRRRRWLTISAVTAVSALFALPAGAAPGHPTAHPRSFEARVTASPADDGGGDDDGGEESDEISEGAAQFAEARTSPGTIAPGAFQAAWNDLNKLPDTGGSWKHLTGLPYNSDDPR